MEDRWLAIRGQLESAADMLTKQGVITSRWASGRRVWSVRYRQADRSGRRVHKSIYLGDNAELIRRAQRLLEQFRRREDWCREVESMAKISTALYRAVARNKNRLREVLRG
jgi:type I site-specific restriction endonuclease